MFKIIVAVLLTICFHSISTKSIFDNSTHGADQLIFTQIIFRHGERNPIKSYQNDPWKDESNWPGGFGQLTNTGKMRLYKLGEYFRSRYHSLLGNKPYSKDLIYVQSTDVDRTIMSAELVLAGLFPPQDQEIWNQNILWQPIPVHMVSPKHDYVLGGDRWCPRLEKALTEYKSSSEFQDIFKKHELLLDFLEEKTGEKLRTLGALQILNNTLFIESITNKTLPEWTKKAGDLEVLSTLHFVTDTSTPLMARLKVGFLLRELLNHFSQKIKSKMVPDRSIWLYSAHDTTIAPILNSIGLFKPHSPPYGASLMFELYRTNNGQPNEEFYFQLFYRKSDNEEPTPLDIPLCGTKCTVEKFRNAYAKIIPTGTFEEECGL